MKYLFLYPGQKTHGCSDCIDFQVTALVASSYVAFKSSRRFDKSIYLRVRMNFFYNSQKNILSLGNSS